MHPVSLRRFSLATLLLLAALLPSCGGGSGDDTSDLVRERAEVQSVLDGTVLPTAPPGALVAVLDASGRSTSYAAGLGDTAPATPMRPQDRFRAGSVLKLMVATVVMQLVEEGQLSLDMRLARLLPPERIAGFAHRETITLENLLNHTSGLGDTASSEEHDADVLAHPTRVRSEQEYLDAAMREEQRQPGQHAYANTNYILLGLVIDQVTRSSWRAQLRERLLARLNLHGTSLPEPTGTTMAWPFAHGYQPVPGVGLVDVSHISPSMAGAAGGHALVTTTTDLARFASALFGGRLYRQSDTLQRMLRFVPAEPIGDLAYSYGLGVMRHESPDGAIFLGHGGSTAGYSCAILYDPVRQLVVVAARNAPDLGETYLDIGLPVLRRLQAQR